jgi:hypothetical protein
MKISDRQELKMIEYWAVIGLACVDSAFRKEMYEAAGSKDLRPFHAALQEKYNFRLSRLELGELQRVFRQPGILDSMEAIQLKAWGRACCTGMTYDSSYVHPERKHDSDCF